MYSIERPLYIVTGFLWKRGIFLSFTDQQNVIRRPLNSRNVNLAGSMKSRLNRGNLRAPLCCCFCENKTAGVF